ncbi:MAG: DUF2189 domain-containing protein [Methylotenera sp.]|jgi:uncharacterized membrane protein
MSDQQAASTESVNSGFPIIREIKFNQILSWLKLGVHDLRQAKLASLFYGFVFAVAGFLMHAVLFEASWLLSGLTTGFLLVGPFLAMGLYDLSRRMGLGEKPNLLITLTAWRANLINVGIFAGVLVVILLIWARASLVIFALFFQGGLPTFLDIVHTLITFQQPTFALVYFAVGGFFAAFVFSVSVVAIPLMADKKTDAVTAAIASLIAVVRNPLKMALWALTIVLLVAVGFATFYLGLIITMPIIGHASWHAYKDLVQ